MDFLKVFYGGQQMDEEAVASFEPEIPAPIEKETDVGESGVPQVNNVGKKEMTQEGN